jgi:hypothetical protein
MAVTNLTFFVRLYNYVVSQSHAFSQIHNIKKVVPEETVTLCATISFFTLKMISVCRHRNFFFCGLPSLKDLTFSSGHFVVCYNESIYSSPRSSTLLLASSIPVSFSWWEVDHIIFWPFCYSARPHT